MKCINPTVVYLTWTASGTNLRLCMSFRLTQKTFIGHQLLQGSLARTPATWFKVGVFFSCCAQLSACINIFCVFYPFTLSGWNQSLWQMWRVLWEMHSSRGHGAPNSSTLNIENLEVLPSGWSGVGGLLRETVIWCSFLTPGFLRLPYSNIFFVWVLIRVSAH